MSKILHMTPALPSKRRVLLHITHAVLVLRTLDPFWPHRYWLDRENAPHTKLERTLELAILAGSLSTVQRLVAWGADFRISQDAMLSLAVMKRKADIVAYLLQAGADPSSSKFAAFKFAVMREDPYIYALLSRAHPKAQALSLTSAPEAREAVLR